MYVNAQNFGQSVVRTPTATAKLNGAPLTGLVSLEVTQNSHFTADTFRAVFALSALPPQYGINYFDSSNYDELELIANMSVNGSSPSSLSLIMGQIDQPDVDLVAGTITLEGRDFSAKFLDTKTSEMFQQQTASQIAQTLAKRHGLGSAVTPTTTKAGTFYEQNHVHIACERSEWDLLRWLAEQEGFDLWVSGKTLYFQEPLDESQNQYLLQWVPLPQKAANFTRINLRRSMTLAHDVIVKVKSWNQANGKSIYVQSPRTTRVKGKGTGGETQVYSFRIPNLTKDQAQKWANNKATEISKHEKLISASLPGDNFLTTRNPINLIGTNTAWDQVYYPDTITRSLSFENGYRMEVHAKNHSTESTINI